HAKDPVDLTVRMEADSDFADLFEVKDKLKKKGELYKRVEPNGLVLGYQREKFRRESRITTSQPAEWSEDGFVMKAHVPAHGTFSTCVEVVAITNPARGPQRPKYEHGEAEPRPELEQSVEETVRDAPKVISSWEPLA